MSKPVPGEQLYLYLAASEKAISVVLVQAEGQAHLPIYYVSQVLKDAELHYPPLEKLAYTLIMSVRKLRPYFFDHSVEVLTTFPLRHRPNTVERLLKWAVELGQFGITYAPWTVIKGQAMANFIVELTYPQLPEKSYDHPWYIYVDGLSASIQARVLF